MATKSFTPWSTDMTLVAVSLNIGGRNTNPLEFLLDGDSTISPPKDRLGLLSQSHEMHRPWLRQDLGWFRDSVELEVGC